MKALILAAGYGTRLKALGENTPKALLEIAQKPLVNHILERIEGLNNLTEVMLVTNDKFYTTFQQWAQATQFSVPIKIINDGTKTPEERLGSIGDIDFTIKKTQLKDDLLVVGGDNLFNYNLDDFIDFSCQKNDSVSMGLYDIHNLEEATQFGVVGVDESSKIISFEEKPQNPKSTLIAMCFYYLPKNSLNLIGEYLDETKISDTSGDYIRWLRENHDVYGFKFTGKWYDIGSIEAYEEAQEKFKD
ncbi:hypothetical protein MNBD_UNCLBAC01-1625 [hydrothermal vent metagenome]|uniref:Nucleotidyl transferase domain-containing protein n=1 Tax=hydrothermal vent metagenome TaxID=652676 RepID=A0A3B1DE39_9ZZZZ